MPNPLRVCRYHSLAAEPATLPKALRVTSQSEDGVIMSVSHREYPVVGLQFHPESILTDRGYQLLANYLQLAGLTVRAPLPSWDSELQSEPARGLSEPDRPVTF